MSDFVQRFCERVIREDSTDLAVHLACRFGGYDIVRALRRKYPENLLVRPYYIVSLFAAGKDVAIEDVIGSIQDALSLNPAPWIELDLQILLWMTSLQMPKETLVTNEASARIKQLFEEDEQLECFKPKYYHAILQNLQTEPSLEMLHDGIEIAKKYDDLSDLVSLYGIGVWIYRNHDIQKAKEFNGKSQELRVLLGRPEIAWYTLNQEASIHNTCGEFDASARCYQKAIDMIEKGYSFRSRRYLPMNLSKIFHEMGQFEEALEYGQLSLEDQEFLTFGGNPRMSAHLRTALALASLGRIEEADEHRAIGQKLALDSEDEIGLAESQYVLGMMEKVKGNFRNAIECFEEAYRVFERINRRVRMNYALRHLAECEVAMFSDGPLDVTSIASTKWLDLFENSALERHYPGYLGIALVYKAELRAKQGLIEKARECLSEALEISKRPETKYLQNMIAKLLNKTELNPAFDA
ncbi:MAG: hypothetical protein ACXADC_14740 [Candidatus Thorarchaeota archaeon]